MYKTVWLWVASVFMVIASPEPTKPLPVHPGAFQSMFGGFDKAALQRGFQVYREVCSPCHSLKHIAFRHLAALGWSDKEIKALAAQYVVKDVSSETGEEIERPCTPSDFIPSPYLNDIAAKAANNGAMPVDLSLIVKARKDGANYVLGILTGYAKPPEGVTLGPGQHYNAYFPGGVLSMPPPLVTEGQVSFADETAATVQQMAEDVVTFLAWASEPESDGRKRDGVKVLMYLAIMSVVMWLAKRRIWKDIT